MRLRRLFILVLLSVLVACGGGKKSSSNTSSGAGVTITPGTASVPTNTTAQFTATVSSSSSGVYWSVNDVVGGNLTVGTISSSGLYTAPAVVPSTATVTIKATSVADTTQSATATVTITTGTALSITIAPATASIYTGRTQQFTATFNTNVNTAVTWLVNDTIGGDASHGAISSGGLYTAPATVPSPATVTVKAVSQADTTKTATAQVTVVLGTTIVVSPAFANVPAGGTQTFTATANSAPIPVTWSLNCNSTQAGACGSISTAGVYTAPPFPPPGGGAVGIIATSTDQSALPAGANLVVQISNGSLVGPYAFSFAGRNSGTGYASAGTITFDGAGVITGGTQDVNNGVSTQQVAITGGTYHLGIDGRGNASVTTASGTENWQIVIRNNTKAFVMRADSTVTGAGALYLQDPTKFAAGLSGPYALHLSGPVGGQTGSASVAAALAAGSGVFSGKLDASSGTTASTALVAGGSYAAASATTGRGTATVTSSFGTQNLVYYIVDATRAVLVETDAANVLRGDLVQQPSVTITAATLVGSYAMVLSGSTSTPAPLALGAVFTLDGNGNVTAGVADINSNGNIQSQVPMTGTYAVTDATTGRTEATVTINGQARKFVLYSEAGAVATVLEIDGVQTAIGRAYRQASGVSLSLFQGSYATRLAGTDFINSPGEEDGTGVFTPNGVGGALLGTLDVNDGGSVVRNASISASYLASTTAGRASGTMTTTPSTVASGQFVYYVVDALRALILETDSTRVLTGSMERPY